MLLAAVAAYIVSCAAVGFFGRKRAIGFIGCFLFSLVISPIVMAIILLVAMPRQYSS